MNWAEPSFLGLSSSVPWHVEDFLEQEWDTGLGTAEHTTSLKGASTLSYEHFSGTLALVGDLG